MIKQTIQRNKKKKTNDCIIFNFSDFDSFDGFQQLQPLLEILQKDIYNEEVLHDLIKFEIDDLYDNYQWPDLKSCLKKSLDGHYTDNTKHYTESHYLLLLLHLKYLKCFHGHQLIDVVTNLLAYLLHIWAYTYQNHLGLYWNSNRHLLDTELIQKIHNCQLTCYLTIYSSIKELLTECSTKESTRILYSLFMILSHSKCMIIRNNISYSLNITSMPIKPSSSMTSSSSSSSIIPTYEIISLLERCSQIVSSDIIINTIPYIRCPLLLIEISIHTNLFSVLRDYIHRHNIMNSKDDMNKYDTNSTHYSSQYTRWYDKIRLYSYVSRLWLSILYGISSHPQYLEALSNMPTNHIEQSTSSLSPSTGTATPLPDIISLLSSSLQPPLIHRYNITLDIEDGLPLVEEVNGYNRYRYTLLHTIPFFIVNAQGYLSLNPAYSDRKVSVNTTNDSSLVYTESNEKYLWKESDSFGIASYIDDLEQVSSTCNTYITHIIHKLSTYTHDKIQSCLYISTTTDVSDTEAGNIEILLKSLQCILQVYTTLFPVLKCIDYTTTQAYMDITSTFMMTYKQLLHYLQPWKSIFSTTSATATATATATDTTNASSGDNIRKMNTAIYKTFIQCNILIDELFILLNQILQSMILDIHTYRKTTQQLTTVFPSTMSLPSSSSSSSVLHLDNIPPHPIAAISIDSQSIQQMSSKSIIDFIWMTYQTLCDVFDIMYTSECTYASLSSIPLPPSENNNNNNDNNRSQPHTAQGGSDDSTMMREKYHYLLSYTNLHNHLISTCIRIHNYQLLLTSSYDMNSISINQDITYDTHSNTVISSNNTINTKFIWDTLLFHHPLYLLFDNYFPSLFHLTTSNPTPESSSPLATEATIVDATHDNCNNNNDDNDRCNHSALKSINATSFQIFSNFIYTNFSSTVIQSFIHLLSIFTSYSHYTHLYTHENMKTVLYINMYFLIESTIMNHFKGIEIHESTITQSAYDERHVLSAIDHILTCMQLDIIAGDTLVTMLKTDIRKEDKYIDTQNNINNSYSQLYTDKYVIILLTSALFAESINSNIGSDLSHTLPVLVSVLKLYTKSMNRISVLFTILRQTWVELSMYGDTMESMILSLFLNYYYTPMNSQPYWSIILNILPYILQNNEFITVIRQKYSNTTAEELRHLSSIGNNYQVNDISEDDKLKTEKLIVETYVANVISRPDTIVMDDNCTNQSTHVSITNEENEETAEVTQEVIQVIDHHTTTITNMIIKSSNSNDDYMEFSICHETLLFLYMYIRIYDISHHSHETQLYTLLTSSHDMEIHTILYDTDTMKLYTQLFQQARNEVKRKLVC